MDRSRSHVIRARAWDAGFVAAFVLALAVSLLRLARLVVSLDVPVSLLVVAIVGALGLGWLLADALSGLIHFLADAVLSPETPFIGRRFVQPFRDHHHAPSAICAHGLLERSGNNALLAVIPTGAGVLLLRDASPLGAMGCGILLSFACFLALTNEIHALAHHESPGAGWKALQAWGVILSPSHHQGHHQGQQNSHYCITSGICDRLFFRLPILRDTE